MTLRARTPLLAGFLFLAVSTAPGESSPLLPDGRSLPSGPELIRRNLDANGGLSNLDALQSVLARGVVSRPDGSEQTFRVYRKRPNRMKYIGEMDEITVTMVYDGKEAWRKIVGPGGRAEVTEVTGADLEELSRSSIFEDPVLRHRLEPEKVKPVAFEWVGEEPSIRVELVDVGEGDYGTVWISTEHFQPIKMERRITRDDETGESVVSESVFLSDYRKVNGVYVAMQIDEWRGGEMVKEMRIESIKPNVGIFDSFFAKP